MTPVDELEAARQRAALAIADRLAAVLERGMNARRLAMRDVGAAPEAIDRMTGPTRDLLKSYRSARNA
jgi:hypothetical protein